MCQRPTRFLAEPHFFSMTIQEPPEFRRAFSAKSYSSGESSPTRSLNRSRTSSIRARASNNVPTVNIRKPSLSRGERTSHEGRSRRSHMLTRQDDRYEGDHYHHSRSVSPHPHSRKEPAISIVGRTWKSADVDKEVAAMQNANALSIRTNGMDQQLSVDANSSHDTSPKKSVQLTLSSKHKKVLRSTFMQMNSGGTFLKLMEQVFRRLEAKYPDIRSIFLTTAFVNSLSREKPSPSLVRTEHDHCKCLVSLFEKIVENLNEIEAQLNPIRSFGEKHAQMKESGMSGTMIEHFGEIAVAVIASQDSIKYNHDAVKAWRLLLAYVTDEMMVGFDRLSRISERKCSNVSLCPRRT